MGGDSCRNDEKERARKTKESTEENWKRKPSKGEKTEYATKNGPYHTAHRSVLETRETTTTVIFWSDGKISANVVEKRVEIIWASWHCRIIYCAPRCSKSLCVIEDNVEDLRKIGILQLDLLICCFIMRRLNRNHFDITNSSIVGCGGTHSHECRSSALLEKNSKAIRQMNGKMKVFQTGHHHCYSCTWRVCIHCDNIQSNRSLSMTSWNATL